MARVVLLASFNMDLVMRAERLPQPGETLQGDFSTFLGGKGFNQAVASKRLGADVAVIGRVGDDEFGRAFLSALDAEGIDRKHVGVDPHAGTGVASIVVDRAGENAILQSPRANRHTTAADVRSARETISRASAVIFQLELSDEGAKELVLLARDAGVPVVFNPAPAGRFDEDLLAGTDILVANAIEARSITGLDASSVGGAFDAAEMIRKRGPHTVAVTLGAGGAVAVSDGGRLHAPAFAVDVVDSVGAGDAFCGAFSVRLVEVAQVADALTFANAAGAIACTRRGAEPSMPRRSEIEAFLRDH
jgi:ribokinase